jgi:hypothetical protein
LLYASALKISQRRPAPGAFWEYRAPTTKIFSASGRTAADV